ncbi:hypothetical protein DV737_g1728, partial [Chaetothyriales sp. CBS 132003]
MEPVVLKHPDAADSAESASSRLSMRSDSNHGDENWDVLVDEHASIKDAVALAKSKGIPLPANLPRSALEGGTIRRLKGKEIKRAIADDWSDDLDLPSSTLPLKLAKPEERDLSESLRQISAAFHSSPKTLDVVADANKTIRSPKARTSATPISLDAFRDTADDNSYDDVPTIRVAKHRSPQRPSVLDSPPPQPRKSEGDNMEDDLELPTDGQLKLSAKRPSPRTPQQNDDFDFEWGESSLGTRNAGRRAALSGRSSSVSALSPSVSSAFTAESEDESLEGLVLPDSPIKFREKLQKRKEHERPAPTIQPTSHSVHQTAKPSAEKDDFLHDFDLGDGDVFDSAKLTLNRNIKQKPARPASPSKRTTTTINFTSIKTQGAISRLPRFQPSHERARSNLEPVSETGAPRSIPGMRSLGVASPTKAPGYIRPPSRQEAGSRLNNFYDRHDSRLGETRKPPPVPFLPAGAHGGQSQHVSLKTTTTARHVRRQDSDGSGDSMSAAQRSLSRLVGLGRPETPGRGRSGMTAAELAAQAKKQMTKPTRRRNYGDGTELEIFDDLPTSTSIESQYTKAPVGRGAPRSLRSKLGLSQFNQSTTSLTSSRTGTETPMPATPLSPSRQDLSTPTTATSSVPHFARDTAASRIARQQRQISTTFQNVHGDPLQPISANFRVPAQQTASSRATYASLRKKKTSQQKPHLIKPMGHEMNRPKDEKGMHYNPQLYRWEGNENALAPFDVPDFNPRQASPLGHKEQTSPNGKANVALISNIGNVSGVQVVGGMVFDPRQMRWLKMAPEQQDGRTGLRSGGQAGDIQVEEEEDVFAGLEDLKEEDEVEVKSLKSSVFNGSSAQQYGLPCNFAGGDRQENRRGSQGSGGEAGSGKGDDSGDEYGGGVAEEFDVGPEFGPEAKMEAKMEAKLEAKMEAKMEARAVMAGIHRAHGSAIFGPRPDDVRGVTKIPEKGEANQASLFVIEGAALWIGSRRLPTGLTQAITSVSMTEYAPRGSQDHNAFFPNSHFSLSQYSNDSGINDVYSHGQIPYSTVNGTYGSYSEGYLPSHHDPPSVYLSMPNTVQYTVLPPGRGSMLPARSLTYPYHASMVPTQRSAEEKPRLGGVSADLNLNPMADIEEQTSYNAETMLSEPIMPPLAGYPGVNAFDELVRDYVGALSPKKQDKALIHSRRAANILAVLVDKKTTAVESAQFRFWVKKMFTLLPNDPSMPDVGSEAGSADMCTDYWQRKKKICHEGKPVAVREKLFKILTRAHRACQHGGRDKTSAQVRRVYSWVPKELISRFIKLCPTCKVRRGQNRGSIQTPDKQSPEEYGDCAEVCSPSKTSRRESEATKRSSVSMPSPLQMQGSSSLFAHQNRWMTTSQAEDGKIPNSYSVASERSYLRQEPMADSGMADSGMAHSGMASSTSSVGRSDDSLTFTNMSGGNVYSPSGFPSSNMRSTNQWQQGPPEYEIKQETQHYDTDIKYQQ